MRSALNVCCVLVLVVCGCRVDEDDWDIRLLEQSYAPSSAVWGVGLEVSVGLRVDKLLGFDDTPEGFEILPDEPTAVETIVTGSKTIGRGEFLEVLVRPLRRGGQRLRFIADNIEEVGEIGYTAEEVTAARFALSGAGWSSQDDELNVFVTMSVAVTPQFLHNGLQVTGRQPPQVKSTPSSATAVRESVDSQTQERRYALALDDDPHDVELSTEVTEDTALIHVVDEGSIGQIEWSVRFADRTGDAIKVESGKDFRLALEPRTTEGEPIHGRPKTNASVEITGAVLRQGSVSFDTARFEALEAGSATIHLEWGSATVDIPVEVTEVGS